MFKSKRKWTPKRSKPSPPQSFESINSPPILIPQLPLSAVDSTESLSDVLSSTQRQEFVITPTKRTVENENKNVRPDINRIPKIKPRTSPQISELAVEVIPVPGPHNNNNSSAQKQDSLPEVTWTTTTNTSSYTISSSQNDTSALSIVSRPLEEHDVDLFRDFIIKVDGAQEAKKFTDKSFIHSLLADQKRNVVNIIFIDAWYVVALVSIVIDKRPWQKHNHARVIEFKILPTHRNLKVMQIIVENICVIASNKRCARIIVHASPADFKLFASAEWVVETKRLSRIQTATPDMNVEKSWKS